MSCFARRRQSPQRARRVAEYNERYTELQAAANALPQIEAEYTQLTRDYEVIKTRYDKLLERRESAQISGDMEASDVVMGFRVIDPPQVPLAPSAPNRPLLMSLVLLAALGGGFGTCFSDQPDQAHVQRRAQAEGGERAAGARDGRHGLDRRAENAPDLGTGRARDFLR